MLSSPTSTLLALLGSLCVTLLAGGWGVTARIFPDMAQSYHDDPQLWFPFDVHCDPVPYQYWVVELQGLPKTTCLEPGAKFNFTWTIKQTPKEVNTPLTSIFAVLIAAHNLTDNFVYSSPVLPNPPKEPAVVCASQGWVEGTVPTADLLTPDMIWPQDKSRWALQLHAWTKDNIQANHTILQMVPPTKKLIDKNGFIIASSCKGVTGH